MSSNGLTESEDAPATQKQVRVWVDGCFDMVHFGHANALRQAKLMGDILVVALHSNADITAHKGLPVTTEEERYKMIRAIKWVDEVIEDIPCYTSVELLEKHNCDICAHGDDFAANADGVDSYAAVKTAGKYREYKRTEGVSTTDLLQRLLQMTQQHLCANEVNRYEGRSYPIMSLQQRVLSVLACKYVSDVIIGAPYTVTESMLDNLKVDYVLHGQTPVYPNKDGSDPYEAPKTRGIYRTIESGSALTTDVILQRIYEHRLEYIRRNSAKEAKEERVLESLKKRRDSARVANV
ncbi:Ethanolamine-phosphate cytidylyltransferase [Geodia barretti]|uniref:ethanolamine-phosphate cytidylyltransferase n=1 Tax=Geodia barretti TaxID=519541 RepID=A0AA35SQU7_GEOBA|nr:Ethanolamine-phosphate cytidylyltransferase [Geodia barretti]